MPINPTIVILTGASLFATLTLITDLRTYKIPNKLTVPAFAAGIVANLIAGAWVGSSNDTVLFSAASWFGWSLAGFAIGFGILYLLWMFGGSGGGDTKMIGALGAWVGPYPILTLLFSSAIIAFLITICVLCYTFLTGGYSGVASKHLDRKTGKQVRKKGESVEEAAQRAKSRRRIVPLGLPVMIATWGLTIFTIIVNYLNG